jgi:hypothetical protein
MQHRQGSSWRLNVNDSQLLNYAVFVRQAARLSVPESREFPPSLGGPPQGQETTLGVGNATAVGQQWMEWWRRLVLFELSHQAVMNSAPVDRSLVQQRLEDYGQVFDPPTFKSVREWPELHLAVIATVDYSLKARRQTSNADRSTSQLFDWNLASEIAETIMTEQQVRPDQVTATVLTVDYPAPWAHVPAPGTLICTTGLTANEESSRAALSQTFRSALG